MTFYFLSPINTLTEKRPGDELEVLFRGGKPGAVPVPGLRSWDRPCSPLSQGRGDGPGTEMRVDTGAWSCYSPDEVLVLSQRQIQKYRTEEK